MKQFPNNGVLNLAYLSSDNSAVYIGITENVPPPENPPINLDIDKCIGFFANGIIHHPI